MSGNSLNFNKKMGNVSNADRRPAKTKILPGTTGQQNNPQHLFQASGVSQAAGLQAKTKKQNRKQNSNTVGPRTLPNQDMLREKRKLQDSRRRGASSRTNNQPQNSQNKDSLKFGVTYDRENGSIRLCIDEYERRRVNKQQERKRYEMYVKVNICCNGIRITDKKRKCKTKPVTGSTSFKYKEDLNISVEDGFRNKQLLVSVWEKRAIQKNTLVSGILQNIDGPSDSEARLQTLKSKSEIEQDIRATANPDEETDVSLQQSSKKPESRDIKEVNSKPKETGSYHQSNRRTENRNIIPKPEETGSYNRSNRRTENSNIIEVTPKPKGIQNLGNTCYANSVLQVLCQTPGFKKRLEHDQNSTVKYLLDVLYHEGDQCIRHLLNIIFKSDDSFRLGKQNDSHSFLLALFACIQEDTNNKACRLFEGVMFSRYSYSTCSHEEDVDQPFTSLLMPITSKKNLQGCIHELYKEDVFEENLVPCRLCQKESTVGKDGTKTWKRLLFANLPEILVFQMGRFEEHKMYRSTTLQKKTTCITFEKEIEMLEMDKESRQSNTIPYRLYGVVNHGGSIHGGHYTACVKISNKNSETWYECSDLTVNVTSDPSRRSSEAAYLLFYHKIRQ